MTVKELGSSRERVGILATRSTVNEIVCAQFIQIVFIYSGKMLRLEANAWRKSYFKPCGCLMAVWEFRKELSERSTRACFLEVLRVLTERYQYQPRIFYQQRRRY